jgi:hypothetical protein
VAFHQSGAELKYGMFRGFLLSAVTYGPQRYAEVSMFDLSVLLLFDVQSLWDTPKPS